MICETLQYVDASGDTQEIAISGTNLSTNGPAGLQLKFTPRSHAASTFEIIWAQPPETGIAIPFKSRCIVYAGRTSSTGLPNSFSAGTMLFQGRRTDNDGRASSSIVQTAITLSDAWWDLSKVTFQLGWQWISGGTLAAPTYSTFNWPDVVLFQPLPGETYDPAPVNDTITTWQTILDILNYAIGFASGVNAVELQVGDGAEFVPTYCNWYPVRSAKCSDCLTFALRPHPGVFTEIDYTTTPPTIHFRNTTAMNPVTLPYGSTLEDGTIHLATDIKRLDELIPDAIRLYYMINGTFNGQPVIGFDEDIYPADAPNSLLCQDFSINITGAAQSETIVNFVSTAFDPTDLDLWRTKVSSLKEISEGGQIPDDGSAGALDFLDPTINGGGADSIQVKDDTGAVIDLDTFLYYTDQSVFSWMQLPAGGAVSVVSATVTAGFTYQKNTGGPLNLTPQVPRHSHSMRLKLTTAPTDQYILKQTLNPGEAIPDGLAESIFTELEVPQWKVRHEILQVAATSADVPTLIKPGRDLVNLSGGDVDWETMNAVPQNVSIEFFRTSSGLLAAHQIINTGPVDHLNPDYLVQLYNLFWNRNRSGIDPRQRLTGTTSSTQVDLSADGARENSVPAQADYSTLPIYAPDVLDDTRSNVITPDATQGVITFAQQKSSDGTNYATGGIYPQFTGAGAPSDATLPANAYFRLYFTYLDITTPASPVSYICTTAGNNSTSVWSLQSGGGFVDDYDNTKAYAGGSITRVLTATDCGGTMSVPGTYGLVPGLSVPANATDNQVPQYPEPTYGTVYWKLLSLGTLSSCGGFIDGLAASDGDDDED